MYHLKFKILFSRFAFWVKKKKKERSQGIGRPMYKLVDGVT